MPGMSSKKHGGGVSSASSGTPAEPAPRTPVYWLTMWSIIITLTVLSMVANQFMFASIGLGKLTGAIGVVVFFISWPSIYIRPICLRDWIVATAGLAIVTVFTFIGWIIGLVLLGTEILRNSHWVLQLAGLFFALFSLWAPGFMIFVRTARRSGIWSPG